MTDYQNFVNNSQLLIRLNDFNLGIKFSSSQWLEKNNAWIVELTIPSCCKIQYDASYNLTEHNNKFTQSSFPLNFKLKKFKFRIQHLQKERNKSAKICQVQYITFTVLLIVSMKKKMKDSANNEKE